MTQKLNVLLADAAADNKALFAHGLKQLRLPHSIMWARNYTELFDTLERAPDLNLAIIDIDTPWINGKKSLYEIKAHQQFQRLPIIILTNFKNNRDIDEVYEAGAHYYAIKPYAASNHVETLRKIFTIDWSVKQPVPPKEQFVINFAFV
jgi:CheY-like chemotaxis protein